MTPRLALLAMILASAPGAQAADPPSTRELAQLSLEELADYPITSVSKKAERLSDAEASVFVITAQDIRRSGAQTLPEALRLAPNLQVAQGSANAYAIGARGTYNTSANKLLVLIDGRSVYSPLFAGVFWDVQDVMLEDVERIEVVSGPGGTLWGVNAVNGVINVITRKASSTQGGLVAAGGGNRESGAALRYGGTLGDSGHYRAYGKYQDRAHTRTASGDGASDASNLRQAGFRADWVFSRDSVTLHGNAYEGTIGQPLPGVLSVSGLVLDLGAIPVTGVNLTGAWSHRIDEHSEIALQAYLDRTERIVPPTFAEKLDLFDVQLQHSLRPVPELSVVWGGQYRVGKDRVTNSDVVAFLPARLTQRWASVFAQAEGRIGDSIRVTAGARMERNDYTGTEWLPTLRMGWKVSEDDLLWSAISRTVRAPSRLDRDAFIPGRPPFLLDGGPQVQAEVANVFEVGYRGSHEAKFTYSVTAYRAEYDRLHTQEIAPSGTFLVFASNLEATTYGVEAWGTWQASERLRLSAGYTAQREEFRLKPVSNDAQAVGLSGRDPAHQWRLHAAYSLRSDIDLDVTVRGVAALSNPAVPRYWTADLRAGWRPNPDLEVFVAGHNLADGGHGEFTSELTRTEVGRSAYVGLRWHFGAH
jgi:iron complex outermembrane receptor protein